MRKQLLLLCPLLLLASGAWAAPACVTGSFADYMASGFQCSLGLLTFSNFNFQASGSVAPLPTASTVTVNPIDDGANSGFSFLGPFGAAAGLQLDALIKFVINSTTAAIGGDALSIQGFGATGNGSVQVTESVCVGAAPASDGSCSGTVGSLNVFKNSGGTKAFDSITFAPTNTIGVTKNIIVQGGSTGTPSSAGVSLVINTIPGGPGGGTGGGPVPEPDSLVMLGSGLVVTSLLLRRKLHGAKN
jgi:hypothetical protein